MIKSSLFLLHYTLALLCISFNSSAQEDPCWTVLLLKKGKELELKDNMAKVSDTGFYLYRNCSYQVVAKDGAHYGGRLIDIKRDSLFFTNYLSANMALHSGNSLDTVGLHYTQLDKLRLIADRSLGLYDKLNFQSFNFIFKQDTTGCILLTDSVQLYHNDSSMYELVPYLTAQGINLLYEEYGRSYFYSGRKYPRPDPANKDTTYSVRNVFGFTPTKAEKINGLAFGLYPENEKNYIYNSKDSVMINGVNIKLHPLGFIAALSGIYAGPHPDSIEYYNEVLQKEKVTTINGLNISAFTTSSGAKLNGLSISGATTLVLEINGITLSGLTNFSYKFNGVSIAGISNRATKAKGLQIGLLNKAADMRGIQIGLWNTNGRRSLPFINWQFKEKRKKKKRKKKDT